MPRSAALILLRKRRAEILLKVHHVYQIQLRACVSMYKILSQPSFMAYQSRVSVPRSDRLDISSLVDEICQHRFRFTFREIQRMIVAMHLPSSVTVNRVTFKTYTAFAMLLRRLAYPVDLDRIAVEFGYDRTSTGLIINFMATLLCSKYESFLELWPGLDQSKVQSYADAITNCDDAITNIWGFLDGTKRPIARPQVNQRDSYSGDKKFHAQSYQAVMAPDGLFVSLIGPFLGCYNDLNLLEQSHLEQQIANLVNVGGQTLMLYGDLIYQGQSLVMAGYQDPVSVADADYNDFMGSMRVSVETGFGRVTQLFTFLDFKRMMRTGLSPTAAYYLVSVLLTNCYTCLSGNSLHRFPNVAPPSLERYLNP